MKKARIKNHVKALVVILLTVFLAVSCKKNEEKKANAVESVEATEDFHANNDIAMQVSSIVDAIDVGEPLEAETYDFKGILTDGEGRPLYTDKEGMPGEWEIKVSDGNKVQIRNLKNGDLKMADLKGYLISALNLNESELLPVTEGDEDGIESEVYTINGGVISFEIHPEKGPLGENGPYFNITILKN